MKVTSRTSYIFVIIEDYLYTNMYMKSKEIG